MRPARHQATLANQNRSSMSQAPHWIQENSVRNHRFPELKWASNEIINVLQIDQKYSYFDALAIVDMLFEADVLDEIEKCKRLLANDIFDAICRVIAMALAKAIILQRRECLMDVNALLTATGRLALNTSNEDFVATLTRRWAESALAYLHTTRSRSRDIERFLCFPEVQEILPTFDVRERRLSRGAA